MRKLSLREAMRLHPAGRQQDLSKARAQTQAYSILHTAEALAKHTRPLWASAAAWKATDAAFLLEKWLLPV